MDKRSPLAKGYVLSFPGMECTVRSIIGRGSNSIAYLCQYPDKTDRRFFHCVIVKELFPLEPDGKIFRDKNGCIIFSEAEEYFFLHKKSFVRGNEVHLELLEASPDKIGSHINTFSLNGTLYSVMGFDGGRTLENTYEIKTLKDISAFMLQFLDALGAFHENGYLHLDISPDNILITGSGENRRVSLIDFNSVYRKDEIYNGSVTYFSLKDCYSAPEIVSGMITDINEATDIYSATAVFFSLVTGRTLTDMDRTGKRPPAIKKTDIKENVPDTVIYHISSIFRKGLSTLSSKRYKSCLSMKEDIRELIRRLEGTGVTHASLWEAGRYTVRNMIKANTAFNYINSDEGLYPISFVTSSGESFDMGELISRSRKNKNLLLYGEGGMGKTTVFLSTVIENTSEYSPQKPAVIYVSLYGYNGNDSDYIKNSILSALKFDESVSGMNEARHRLITEFSSTVKTPSGERAKYLLLIDGLNEASGDTSHLFKEILTLSHMNGVMTVVSSREKTDLLPFESIRTAPLKEELVRKILSKKQLIYPENREIQFLITNPMMLSVYCKTAENKERQLLVDSERELIKSYISSLAEKEKRSFPENSPVCYFIDAVAELVLPAICREGVRKNRAITDEELYLTVKKCFSLLSEKRFPRLFPHFAGHSRDIKAGCATAEEWLGVVENLLRFKLALIVKEPGKGTRAVHQNIGEYLASEYIPVEKKIKRQKVVRITAYVSLALSLVVLSLGLILSLVTKDTYDEKLSLKYLECVTVAGANNGRSISLLDELIKEYHEGDMSYIYKADELLGVLEMYSTLNKKGASGSRTEAETLYKKLKDTGSIMTGSGEAVTEDDLTYLYNFNESILGNYDDYVNIFLYVTSDAELYEKYGEEFINLLSEKVSLDAALSDMLSYYTVKQHIEYLKSSDSERYGYFLGSIGEYSSLSEDDPEMPDIMDIESMSEKCSNAQYKLQALEIFTIYERNMQK